MYNVILEIIAVVYYIIQFKFVEHVLHYLLLSIKKNRYFIT